MHFTFYIWCLNHNNTLSFHSPIASKAHVVKEPCCHLACLDIRPEDLLAEVTAVLMCGATADDIRSDSFLIHGSREFEFGRLMPP